MATHSCILAWRSPRTVHGFAESRTQLSDLTHTNLTVSKSWTIKKAEHQRTAAFELWCWRLLRVPWTARRSNQSILKEIESWIFNGRTDAEAEAPLQRADSLEKTLMLGKMKAGREGGDRRWDGWMVSPTQWTWVWASSRRWSTGKPGIATVHGVTKNWTRLSDWTIITTISTRVC